MIYKRSIFSVITIIFLLYCTGNNADSHNIAVTGYVFQDSNGNQVMDNNEKGLPDVCVSNGIEVVKTDVKGKYSLIVTNDIIIFVIKPRGYMTPIDENRLPQILLHTQAERFTRWLEV